MPYSTYVHKWLKKRILLKLEITKTAINANYWIGRKWKRNKVDLAQLTRYRNYFPNIFNFLHDQYHKTCIIFNILVQISRKEIEMMKHFLIDAWIIVRCIMHLSNVHILFKNSIKILLSLQYFCKTSNASSSKLFKN